MNPVIFILFFLAIVVLWLLLSIFFQNIGDIILKIANFIKRIFNE